MSASEREALPTLDDSPSPANEARTGSVPRRLLPFLVACVLVLAAFMRLAGLEDRPRWYHDELFNLKVIQDLLAGELRVRAVSWTCFSPFHPYPMGYHLFGAAFCAVLGDSLWAVRFMCGLIGVATTLFVFLTGRVILNDMAGLIAAVAYAVHPKVVLFTRMAFPQNLSPLLVIAAVWAGLHYVRSCGDSSIEETGPESDPDAGPPDGEASARKSGPQKLPAGWQPLHWLIVFSLLVGGSLAAIYWAGVLLFVLVAVVLLTRPQRVLVAISLALVPIALQFLVVMLVHGPEPVFYDLSRLFGVRIAQSDAPGVSFLEVVGRTVQGCYGLFVCDPFFLGGLLGLCWVPNRRYAAVLFGSLSLLSLPPIAQRGEVIADCFYSAIVFASLPFLGFGVLFGRLLEGAASIRHAVKRSWARVGASALVLASIGLGWSLSFRDTVSLEKWPHDYETQLDRCQLTIESRRAALASRLCSCCLCPCNVSLQTPRRLCHSHSGMRSDGILSRSWLGYNDPFRVVSCFGNPRFYSRRCSTPLFRASGHCRQRCRLAVSWLGRLVPMRASGLFPSRAKSLRILWQGRLCPILSPIRCRHAQHWLVH